MEEQLIFDLSDLSKYKAYFALIASQHKSLGADKFIFGDVEVGQSEAAEWSGKKLWALPADKSRLQDQLSDNLILAREATIWVGGSSASEKFEDEDAFYVECETIIKQIISRMMVDKYEGKLSTPFANASIQRADMMISSTHFIGCEFVFTILDPTGFEYSEGDWNL